jgi:hypothetical protein
MCGGGIDGETAIEIVKAGGIKWKYLKRKINAKKNF